jgi:hypothetical protein
MGKQDAQPWDGIDLIHTLIKRSPTAIGGTSYRAPGDDVVDFVLIAYPEGDSAAIGEGRALL